MGLHRDGSNFGLPPIETEVRRRIWWHIIHTDVMTSIPSALPPSCLSDTIYDAKMICELKDDHISTPRSQDYDSMPDSASQSPQKIYQLSMDPSLLDVRLMVAVDRYSITSTLRRILRRQFDTTPLTRNDFSCLKEEINALDVRISARIGQLCRLGNRELEPTNNIYDESFDQRAFTEWAQLLLKLMVHKTYCVLYQPLVRNSDHVMWGEVRSDCILHSQSFMEAFFSMTTSTTFRPYHWLYPGLYQPLHAAVVLLSDLLRSSNSPEAGQSRILIDRMFSLISPHDGVVSEENGISSERNLSEGGREAWALIRRLRRKAWESMGLDPDILWTEDSCTTSSGERMNLEQQLAPPHRLSEPGSASLDLDSHPSRTSLDSGLRSDVRFSPSEYSDHLSGFDSSGQFTWIEWDAAMAGSFDSPVYSGFESVARLPLWST